MIDLSEAIFSIVELYGVELTWFGWAQLNGEFLITLIVQRKDGWKQSFSLAYIPDYDKDLHTISARLVFKIKDRLQRQFV